MRLVLVLSVLGVVRALWGSAPQDDAPVSVRVRHPWYKDVDGGAAYVLEMLEAAADIWPNDMAALVSRAYAPDALTRLSLKEATHNELYSAMEGVVYEHARARDSQQRLDEWRAAVAWPARAGDRGGHGVPWPPPVRGLRRHRCLAPALHGRGQAGVAGVRAHRAFEDP